MSDRWKSVDTLTRAVLFDWETRTADDDTQSVERGTGDDLQVLVAGVDTSLAVAIESAIYTLDSLLAHARGEAPQ